MELTKRGYHNRVDAKYGKPSKCEVCKTTTAKRYEWANLTGNYDDVDDYKRMCMACHRKYDIANGQRKNAVLPKGHKLSQGELHHSSVLTEKDVVEIRHLLKEKRLTQKQIAKMFGEPSFAKGSGMVNRAVNIDVKPSKAHEILIPDKVHQEEVLDDVEARKIKNKTQNQMVLELFMKDKARRFTAWQVCHRLKLPLIRITSIRRAMSDLTKEGLLVKLGDKVMEREGENNHLYQFRKR